MLRSWIEHVQRRFAPRMSVGLTIGRDYVGIAQLTAADGGRHVQSLGDVKLDAPLFSGTPSPQAVAALTKGLQTFAGDLANRYLPVHVSIPDAAVRMITFELDALPKTRAAQLDLVRFRFGRESTNGSDVYTCQSLGRDGDKYLLLGMALDSAWQQVITDALTQVGVVAWTLNANTSRQFNRFHDRLAQTSGALVALTPEAWSLWVWDAQGRLRYARSRWRGVGDDHADIAKDVERSILAYIHGHPERTVTRVYSLAGNETDAIVTTLNARLREPSVRLSFDEGVVFDPSADRHCMLATSSLAAAFEQ